MIKRVVEQKDPHILIITPLKEGAKVSKQTKKTIKRTKTPYTWITYMGKGNPAYNTNKGLKEYRKNYDKMPHYVIKLDNDVTASRGMLDKMYNALERQSIMSTYRAGYAYCAFKFEGAVNVAFGADPFNIERLLQHNYISFNSLIVWEALRQSGGFVTDDKYFRLLDWALWLKMYSYGYLGLPVHDCSFVAYASPNSVSARGQADYEIRHKAVTEDFALPIRRGETKWKNGRLVING